MYIDNNYQFLSKNIKHFRKQLEISRDELADVVGVSASQIGLIERDQISNPGYFLIESLSNYFGVTERDLVRIDMTQIDISYQISNRCKSNLTKEEPTYVTHQIDGITRDQVKNGFFRINRRVIKAKNP